MCLFLNLFMWLSLRVLVNVFPPIVPLAETPLRAFAAPFVLQMLNMVHNRMTLHTHFVHKIVAFEAMLAIEFLLMVNPFRKFMLAYFGYPTIPTVAAPPQPLSYVHASPAPLSIKSSPLGAPLASHHLGLPSSDSGKGFPLPSLTLETSPRRMVEGKSRRLSRDYSAAEHAL